MKKEKDSLYGILAEFKAPEGLLHAAEVVSQKGYKKVEAYSPFPLEGLHKSLGIHDRRLPFLVLLAGIIGGLGGFFMQYFASVIDYPILVGGRPLNSWPAFIPVTFELTILAAAAAAVFGMIVMNGLPQPYHPVFNAEHFERATQDRFFLCVSAKDKNFKADVIKKLLASLEPESVTEVPE